MYAMKKGRILLRISILIMAVALSSCSAMLFTSIDILRPAKVTFPADITNVVLINNSVIQDPDYGHTVKLLNQRERKISLRTDSLSIYCLAALAEGIAGKEFFRSVILEPNSINNLSFTSAPSPPDREIIQAIATRNRAEGIISLNRILVNDKQGEFYNEDANSFVSYLEAVYETQWSVHYPLKNQIYTFSVKDTVFWESEAYSRQKALQGLPDHKNALIDGALITGERNVNRFIPWWDKVDRYLFDSQSKRMKAGMNAFYRKDWNSAIATWSSQLETGNNISLSGKLAHNIAVTNEIKGDIRQAKSFSDQALEFFMSSLMMPYDQLMMVLNYNEELAVRLREVDKVNSQLGEKP